MYSTNWTAALEELYYEQYIGYVTDCYAVTVITKSSKTASHFTLSFEIVKDRHHTMKRTK